MTPLERRLVERLVFDPESMSRNRNFHTFHDPVGRRAWRIAAHLRSVRRAVQRAGAQSRAVRGADGRWEVQIREDADGVRRQAWLTDDEMDLLRQDPTFARNVVLEASE